MVGEASTVRNRLVNEVWDGIQKNGEITLFNMILLLSY